MLYDIISYLSQTQVPRIWCFCWYEHFAAHVLFQGSTYLVRTTERKMFVGRGLLQLFTGNEERVRLQLCKSWASLEMARSGGFFGAGDGESQTASLVSLHWRLDSSGGGGHGTTGGKAKEKRVWGTEGKKPKEMCDAGSVRRWGMGIRVRKIWEYTLLTWIIRINRYIFLNC